MFILHADKQIGLATDSDTRLDFLKFGGGRRDVLGLPSVRIDQRLNIHVSLHGAVTRKTEQGELNGTVIWLRKLGAFRGGFDTNLKMSTDAALHKPARALFYEGRYAQFLELSEHISVAYKDSATFQRMRNIAEDRIKKPSST